MRLFDMFKKKNNLDNNEVKIAAVTNNVIGNSIESNRKIAGRYSFLNDILNIKLYSGLTDDEIEIYSQEFNEAFKIDLPEEVKEFLKTTNGVYVNGEVFLSKFNGEVEEGNSRITRKTRDIIGYNENFREMTDIDDYIIFGKDSLSFYVYDIKSQKYQDISNGTSTVLNEYDEFAKMVEDVLTRNNV
jgi:hypothetical protein